MELKEGDKVDLIIGVRTALGYTVLINESYEGLLYENEVFSDVEEGMRTVGYIKKIREDEKIDVSLRPQGFKNVIDEDVDKILKKLHEKGALLLTDKSSPESIKFHLQMSKKAFKRAIGNLYKQRKIQIFDDRIELIKK
ncbi:S1 RNA-binding domain-containing protein [Tenacibaculum agarivorans]|uniref:DNA-binding protein n=1 Tax=Tenacibaculum agarivorans TaxID=1908389 RepID=UPI00094BB680|nr:DNA-binding protein [Tenacibaculum agarivorans]